MRNRAIAASALAVLLATDASAVSVTNRDDRDFKITVIEGDAKEDHVLKPSEVLAGVCQKGCVIRLNDSENDEYLLEGSEPVSIEDGNLYHDGPSAPSGPDAGAGNTPVPSAPKP